MTSDNKNFLEKILATDSERAVIVGEDIVNMRSYEALKKFRKYEIDNRAFTFLAATATLALALILSFLFFLHRQDYPLIVAGKLVGDIWIACYYLAGTALMLMSIAIFSKLFMRVWISLLLGIVLYLSLGHVLSGDVSDYAAMPTDMGSANEVAAIAAAFIFFALSLFMWRILFTFTIAMLTAAIVCVICGMSMTGYPIIWEAPFTKNNSGNSSHLLHIVINRHIGFEYGIEKYGAAATESDADANPFNYVVSGFYQRYGFAMHPFAYALNRDADQELAQLLNFDDDNTAAALYNKRNDSYFNLENGRDSVIVKNRYFASLLRNGYKVNVYHSKGVDLCASGASADISRCYTYQPSYAIGRTKEGLIGAYIASFEESRYLGKETAQLLHMIGIGDYPTAKLQKDVLDQVTNDIAAAKTSSAFFVMLPILEEPYVYNYRCQDTKKNETGFKGYANQLLCAYRMLDGFMARLEARGALANTRVIIHGDGGVKFERGIEPQQLYTADKSIELFKDIYTTVFAVRIPGRGFSFDPAPCDLETLMRNSLFGGSRSCRDFKIDAFSLESIPDHNEAKALWLQKSLSINESAIAENYRLWRGTDR